MTFNHHPANSQDQEPAPASSNAMCEAERKAQGRESLRWLVTQGFMGQRQAAVVQRLMAGEERAWFEERMIELAKRIRSMPETYEQDGLGDQAIAHLHYFGAAGDWYITERDKQPPQLQAFGRAQLGNNRPELGYISLVQLGAVGAELDFHFDPTPLAELPE